MTIVDAPVQDRTAPARRPGRLLRRFGYSLAITPAAVGALGALCAGRGGDVAARWDATERRLMGTALARPGGPTSTGRALTHTLLSVVLGLVGLIELGLVALFVARGVLYGVVDDGPYGDAWGGPTLAGAWGVHFAVGCGVLLAAMLLASAVTALHRQANRWLRGERVPVWVAPSWAVLTAAIAVFVVAFVHQF